MKSHSKNNNKDNNRPPSKDPEKQLPNGAVRYKKHTLQEKKEAKRKETIIKCNQLLSKGEYQTAIKILKTIIENQENSQQTQPFEGVGNIQSWRGLFKDGGKGWLDSLQREGKHIMNVFDLLALAFSLWNNGDQDRLDDCFKWYEDMLEDEESCELFFGYANLYYNSKNYVKAEENYKEALKFNNECAKAYECLGWIYGYWFDDKQLAYQYVARSLELSPNSLTSKFLLAVYEAQDIKKQALLQQILHGYPQYYRVYAALGQIQENYQKAEIYFKKCLQIDSTYTEAYFLWGEYLRLVGNYQQALQLYNKGADNKQILDMAYYYMAILAQHQEMYPEAERYYLKCLSLNFYNPFANGSLAKMLYGMGYLGEAIEHMVKQLYVNPNDYRNANNLGQYYRQAGSVAQSMVYFKKAIELKSDYSQAYCNLAFQLQQNGELEKAIDCFMSAKSLCANDGDIYYGLACCYAKMKRNDVAMEWCRKCVDAGYDQNKDVLQLLGSLYGLMNQTEKALEYYLNHTVQTKSFHTLQIYSKFIKNLEKDQALTLIGKAAMNGHQSEFFYIEIGLIALQLQQQKLALHCFSKVASLQGKKELHPKIAEQLAKFNGRSKLIKKNEGDISYSERISLIGCKKDFEEQFGKLFKQ